MRHRLLPYPFRVMTRRLLLESPDLAHVDALHDAITTSFRELHRWLPWAKKLPSRADVQDFTRLSIGKFTAGEEYNFRLFLRHDRKTLLGVTGLMRNDAAVPSYEIGYWLRTKSTGQGFMTEAVDALVQVARRDLGARRVQLRTDVKNLRSAEIARRLNFNLEGTLHRVARNNAGQLISLQIFARTF